MNKRFKRAVAAILAGLLFMQAVPAAAVEDDTNKITSDGGPVESKVMNEMANSGGISDYSETEEGLNQAVSLPEKYDSRNVSDGKTTHNYVTSVKDQSSEGLCWAYSTLSTAESNILRQGLKIPETWKTNGELELSVGHIGYFPFTQNEKRTEGSYGDYLDSPKKGAHGGNSSIAVAALASGTGAQLELLSPTKSFSSGYSEYQRLSSFYRLKSSSFMMSAGTDSRRNTIKNWILSSGAVDAAFYSATSYFSKTVGENCAYYQNVRKSGSTNHEISIIGWDDSFPVSNFGKVKPSEPGAWLVKNSWGTKVMDKGYMWISYYEPSLSFFTQFEMEPVDSSDHINQYDSICCPAAYKFKKTANVFTTSGDEVLKSIGVDTYPNLNGGVNIWADVYILNKNYSNPEDGKKVASVKKYFDYPGYKQIALDKAVSIPESTKYSVVVRVSDAAGKLTYSEVEEKTSGAVGDFNFSSSRGESYFVEENESEWNDTIDWVGQSGQLGNFPIKAYTDDSAAEEESEDLQSELSESVKKYTELKGDVSNDAEYKVFENLTDTIPLLKNAIYNFNAYLDSKNLVKFPDGISINFNLGDLTKDGNVDSTDATLILIGFATALTDTNGDTHLRYDQDLAGDCNFDGKLTSEDATLLLIYYAQKLVGSTNKTLEEYADSLGYKKS